MENLDFLKTKYNLHASPEVEKAAKRTEKRTGEKVPQKPEAHIQNYLDRFQQIIGRENPNKREHGIGALKRLLHGKFVIKPEEIPESAFLLEQHIAREQGYGDIEITDEFKEQKTAQIINNQTKSLDKWINYLSSPDAQYPDWAKYWAFRSMLDMGKLQKKDDNGKESANFQKRDKDTVASFPLLNPRALALTIGVIRSRLEEKAKPRKERKLVENKSLKLNDQEFQQLLSTENFSKIYAQFLIEMPEYSADGLQEIRGKWAKYQQGSNATELVKSLEGYPLEWCTADFDTAQTQLEGGDFYVYYSINEAGEAIIPRLAIRLEDEHVAEARGIAPDQNLDPYIVPVLEEKLKDFGSEGEAYKKKSADMKLLTEIEKKTKANQPLNKVELIFLYEINSPIEGFGYEKDPRIEEIRQTRNPKEDAPIVFECRPEEIAWKAEDVDENTKAYVGPLFKGIFQKNIENIYTSFPDGRIEQVKIEIGGMTVEELRRAIENKKDEHGINYKISSQAEIMMEDPNFIDSVNKRLKNSEIINLVRLQIKDIGQSLDSRNRTVDELYKLYKRVEELGLELCPPETGHYLLLKYEEVFKRPMPLYEFQHIGMKQIAEHEEDPGMFCLHRDNSITELDGAWGEAGVGTGLIRGNLVFSLRKLPH